ncbi:MAG: argS, partial [Verrucomicrobiales bacterium]|nr:argS [Verrucomicrobiales bacterium]
FRLLGHSVITDNHIGDWGTQFGMLLIGWKKYLDPQALASDPIFELERIYKKVNELAKQDETVWNEAKAELANLQKGDAQNLGIWKQMLALSQDQFDSIYGRLGVRFDHTLGESFYNPRLASLIQELKSSGIATEHEGAIKVFFDDVPQLKETPAVIQKSDGAATYATTDLATLDYRVKTWNPQEIIYVTDGRQQLHFKQIFTVFKKWQPLPLVLAHVWFGSILGDDGTPLKTREGGTVKLVDLLNEAEERTLALVKEKNPELPAERQLEIARVVGIGAVKYADLLPNRQSDYVFSWDKMLAFNGNTGVYVQYAYTRVRSIFKKSERHGAAAWNPASQVVLSAPQELALARHLLNFGIALNGAAEEHRPNYLCNYLFELASLFSSFYESCPILDASPAERDSRLALSDVCAKILKQGLFLLGIETTEQM